VSGRAPTMDGRGSAEFPTSRSNVLRFRDTMARCANGARDGPNILIRSAAWKGPLDNRSVGWRTDGLMAANG